MIKRVLIYNYRQRWKKYADKHEFFADMLNRNILGKRSHIFLTTWRKEAKCNEYYVYNGIYINFFFSI